MDRLPLDVRPSPIAGRWYPGDPAQLAATVDEMLKAAPLAALDGQVVGLLAPHAGYVYSGATAARAFKLIEGQRIERVAVLSPMHQPYPGAVLTTAHDAYRTPLGDVPVDVEGMAALDEQLTLTPVRNDPEHALEIELPFLQRALDGPFKLLPLMLRDQSGITAQALGRALVGVLGADARTLIVASSDLSHFYPDWQARQLDALMLEQVTAFDPQGVIDVEIEGLAFACGRGAIAAMLIACRAMGADHAEVVGYATSADAGSDTARVVGYGAAAITRPVA